MYNILKLTNNIKKINNNTIQYSQTKPEVESRNYWVALS